MGHFYDRGMRILFTEEHPATAQNPYVGTLIDGLKQEFADLGISCGKELFWSDGAFSNDIVHIMWPNGLLINGKTPDDLADRLVVLRERSIKVVATCHNLVPHDAADLNKVKAYDIVYRYADLIIHLGGYSLSLFQQKYPAVRQVLIPHHVYDTIYNTQMERGKAIATLGLDDKFRYLLCFGAFRNEEERRLVSAISDVLYANGIKILAPNFYPLSQSRNPIKRMSSWIEFYRMKRKNKHIVFQRHFVQDGLVEAFFRASDVVLIQRLRILNSGNLPMGFFMGRVVVGPDQGNVGVLLKEHQNPVFNVNSDDLLPAIEEAFRRAEQGLGHKNKMYAGQYLTTEKVVKELYRSYTSLFNL